MTSTIRRPADSRPARGYTWPSFVVGNKVRRTHGAHDPEARQPIEDDLRTWLRETHPHLVDRTAEVAVDAWCRAESMVVLLQRWVDLQPCPVEQSGKPLAVLGQLDRYERSALLHRQQLGLDPRSRLSLLRDLAELEQLEGRRSGALAAAAGEARRVLESRHEISDSPEAEAVE